MRKVRSLHLSVNFHLPPFYRNESSKRNGKSEFMRRLCFRSQASNVSLGLCLGQDKYAFVFVFSIYILHLNNTMTIYLDTKPCDKELHKGINFNF